MTTLMPVSFSNSAILGSMKVVNGCLFIRNRISVPWNCFQSTWARAVADTSTAHSRAINTTHAILFSWYASFLNVVSVVDCVSI